MAVSISDLIAPIGELSADMFPDLDFEQSLTNWIDLGIVAADGYESTIVDKAVIEWVYSHAYHQVALQLAIQPNTGTAEGISETIGADRIVFFENLSKRHKNEFELLGKTAVADSPKIGTRSVKTQVRF